MNELIVIKKTVIGTEEINSVSARDMYEQLGLDKSNWSRWSKQNIIENTFAMEHDDWERFVIMTNGNQTTDYALSIDFAKKLAMQVKTEQGERVRNYFIACEKKLKEVVHLPANITNRQVIALDVKALQDIADIFEIPKHLAQVEIVKDIRKDYGVDLSNYLLQAPAQNNIKDEDMFLEPKELGKLFGLSAHAMNKKLEDFRLQYNERDVWYPTEKGKEFCAKHQWSTQYKSGYNWKWNVKAVKQMMKEI